MNVRANILRTGNELKMVLTSQCGTVREIPIRSEGILNDEEAVMWAIKVIKSESPGNDFVIEFNGDGGSCPEGQITHDDAPLSDLQGLNTLSFCDIAKIASEIPDHLVQKLIDRTIMRAALERRHAGEIADATLVRDIVISAVGCTKGEIYENACMGKLDAITDYNNIVLRSLEDVA